MDVLVVEDEVALGEIIARNLRARGYRTSLAATGEGALDEIAQHRPDVLILDVNLPDITGWDIIRRLDSDGMVRPAVIVISAGSISPRRLEELRPDRHLEKPFHMDALLRALADFEAKMGADQGGG
jgi:DNA-binding response OmpR family regulator